MEKIVEKYPSNMDKYSYTYGMNKGANMNRTNTETAWSWKQSPELMDRLSNAQNHPRNTNVDIMTFAGFCGSEGALRQHVEYYEARAERKAA
jgi:hypothetical protein